MTNDTEWKAGDGALADVRGVKDVEVVRVDDPDLPWRSRERVPDFFGPQTMHPDRHVKNVRRMADRPAWFCPQCGVDDDPLCPRCGSDQ